MITEQMMMMMMMMREGNHMMQPNGSYKLCVVKGKVFEDDFNIHWQIFGFKVSHDCDQKLNKTKKFGTHHYALQDSLNYTVKQVQTINLNVSAPSKL